MSLFPSSVLPSSPPAPSLASTLVPIPLPTPQTALMPPPPQAIYSSKQELYSSIQSWAAQNHFAFRIGRSNKINKGPSIKIFYNCDRCGPPPPEIHPQDYLQARKRRSTTRKTGCQFSVIAVECSDSHWELCHRPGIEHSRHNHPPS